MAVSGVSFQELESGPFLKEAPPDIMANGKGEADKIDTAISKFQTILQLNPNTFTRKQEAIFTLALKEALYEILDVPHHHRDLEEEMLRIKKHEFWK